MRAGWWMVSVCLASACGDDATGPTARFALPESGVPRPLDVPFPSDVYRDADGSVADGLVDWSLVRIDGPAPSGMLEGIGALDGFGTGGGAIFSLDGLAVEDEIDVATLTETNVGMVDLDGGMLVPSGAGWDPYTRTITVWPLDALAPSRRYAAVLTGDVALASGRTLGATSTFAAIRSGSSKSGAAAIYATALDVVAQSGFARDRVIALAPYTTGDPRATLQAIRDRIVSGAYGAAPTLITNAAAPLAMTRFGRTAHAGWTATLTEWLGTPRIVDNVELPGFAAPGEPDTTGLSHDAIGAVLHAAFEAPDFRRAFTGTSSRDDGTIAFEAGNAVAQRMVQVPIMIVLPRGAVPSTGFPVVMFQHGLTGDRMNAMGIVNELARAGIATVAIDAPYHGLRADTATDTANNGAGTYSGPDGHADDSNILALLDMAAELKNAPAARDNYWQAVLDLVSLRRLVGNLDLAVLADEYGGVTPTLDETHVGYVGVSMGSVLGTALASIEPRTSVDPFVLSVPPGFAGRVFAQSPLYSEQTTLIAGAAGVPGAMFDAGSSAAMIHLLQTVVDAIDATTFARAAAADHNVWMIGAEHDDNVPRTSNDAVVTALGATQVLPAVREIASAPQANGLLTGARITGYYELSPADHLPLITRYGDLAFEPPLAPRAEEPRFPKLPQKVVFRHPIIELQQAVGAFLQSTWSGAPAIDVRSPALAPVRDADDDGHCDDAETAAGTSPYSAASTPASSPGCSRDLGFTRP